MADEELLHKVHQLGDLDLAALLCLVNREHCIISTHPDGLDDLVDELQLVASDAFGLTSAVVNCNSRTTLDDLAASLLVPDNTITTPLSRSNSPIITRHDGHDSYFTSQRNTGFQPRQPDTGLPTFSPLSSNQSTTVVGNATTARSPSGTIAQGPLRIANVIFAKDLDRAPKAVQIQCLELLRTRRIFTRTNVQTAPKVFLFIAVLGAESGGVARLSPHLNDFFYIAHWHDMDDGYPRLEEEEEEEQEEEYLESERGSVPREYADDRFATAETSSLASDSSVIRRHDSFSAGSVNSSIRITKPRTRNPGSRPSTRHHLPSQEPLFTDRDITSLSVTSRSVNVDIDVQRYQMNIISFLRMHRAVAGGVIPQATQHFDLLVRSLSTLHGLNYATPSIVALAANKIYLHRIRIVKPAEERSMQWGSDLSAVEALLEGVGPEEVIQDVLGMVAPPI